MFSCEFRKIFKNNYFYRTTLVATSVLIPPPENNRKPDVVLMLSVVGGGGVAGGWNKINDLKWVNDSMFIYLMKPNNKYLKIFNIYNL